VFDALPTAQAGDFYQQGGKALAAQARIQPEAGDTTADDQNVSAQSLGHARASLEIRPAV
jgi:hypothetical protein